MKSWALAILCLLSFQSLFCCYLARTAGLGPKLSSLLHFDVFLLKCSITPSFPSICTPSCSKWCMLLDQCCQAEGFPHQDVSRAARLWLAEVRWVMSGLNFETYCKGWNTTWQGLAGLINSLQLQPVSGSGVEYLLSLWRRASVGFK